MDGPKSNKKESIPFEREESAVPTVFANVSNTCLWNEASSSSQRLQLWKSSDVGEPSHCG